MIREGELWVWAGKHWRVIRVNDSHVKLLSDMQFHWIAYEELLRDGIRDVTEEC